MDRPAGRLRAAKRELPTNCYRLDPSGRLDLVVSEDQVRIQPGFAFSPDYKKLYVGQYVKGQAIPVGAARATCPCFDVGTDNKLSNQKRFSDFMIDGVKCGPDGVRCDVDGNLWASSNAGRHVGYTVCDGMDAGWQAHRPDPPARGVRHHLLRRPQAQPPVHGREPVALRRVYRHAKAQDRADPPAIARYSEGTSA